MPANRPDQASAPERGQCSGRRNFLRSALTSAAVLGAGGLPLVAAGATRPRLDLNNDADLLKAMIKMRGRLDSGLHIGWLRARRFAVSGGRIEPLCGLVSATFNRFTQKSESVFEVTVLEIAHYTDFLTGQLLDRLKMPFVDKVVEVPAYRFGPAQVRFAVRLDEKDRFAPAEGTTEGDFSPAGSVLMTRSIHREGQRQGTLFLRHEEHGRVLPENSTKPRMFYKESTIWSAPAAAVLDPDVQHVDGIVSYSAMTSWRPWMEMGDIPGHTASNGFGGKAASLNDLPEDLRRFTRQRHPDVLKDPGALLDG